MVIGAFAAAMVDRIGGRPSRTDQIPRPENESLRDLAATELARTLSEEREERERKTERETNISRIFLFYKRTKMK